MNKLFILLSFLMGTIVLLSNYLVQFPINYYGLNEVLTYGAFSYPIAFLITDLANRSFGKLDARKKWIISSISPKGKLIIDDGAKKALKNGKSLLAAGIKKVLGNFKKGEHVKVLDNKGKEFARGLSSFSSNEISKILGCHSNEIRNILGYVSKSEVIHKDDMVKI